MENIECTKQSKMRLTWRHFHVWFLQGFLAALALWCNKVADRICLKSTRRTIQFSIFSACAIVVIMFYVKLNVDTHNTHELDSEESPYFPCKRTSKEAEELKALFHDIHDLLNEMGIRHFLIYGSIWGAYRVGGPLPWDYDIDIGIVGDERYSQIPKTEFIRAFEARGISVDDHMKLSSCYYFRRGDFAQVDIDIFYRTRGYMHRTGIVTWILYYNYQKYHTFPAWMVEEPLPRVKFIDKELAVPRGGMEILKLLYPHDWETPFTPAACRLEENRKNEGKGEMKKGKESISVPTTS